MKIDEIMQRAPVIPVIVVERLDQAVPLAEALVEGTGTTHRVRQEGDGFTCTCDWFYKHEGEAGPCKHVLAAQIALEAAEDEA